MLTVIALAPASSAEPSWLPLVLFLGALVNIALLVFTVWWMLRVARLLERAAQAQEAAVRQMQPRPQMPAPARPPSPTQSVFG